MSPPLSSSNPPVSQRGARGDFQRTAVDKSPPPPLFQRGEWQVREPPAPHGARLPDMYDLPSEDPEEPGLPDMFHYFQPQLLQETFQPPDYPVEQVFAAGDLNLYYDLQHPLWHKRPDWFVALGVPKLYHGDLRLSYVIWKEAAAPYLVVELLSEGTEDEDLGKTLHDDVEKPPGKWEVYERILRVPYYVTYSRHTKQFQAFVLRDEGYRLQSLAADRLWLPEARLGLGIWQGEYRDTDYRWLRFYDAKNNWILTEREAEKQRADTERQRADQERQQKEKLIAQLRALGIEPEL